MNAVHHTTDGGGRGLESLIGPLVAIGVFALLVWCWQAIDVDTSQLADGLPRLGAFLGRMVPPDLTVAETVFLSTLETLQIVILGTALSIVASVFLGLLAATNLTPPWVHQPVKWFLAAIRAIPMLLLALIFVSVIGLGALPGVLTIALHSTGMLGKFYAEAFENARPQVMEALEGVGATWAQRIRFGAFVQVLPDLVRDTLFRFELNFRESLVLGLVGAGGVGFYIQLYIRAFQYEKVATLTLVILAMVLLVEQTTSWVRKRLR